MSTTCSRARSAVFRRLAGGSFCHDVATRSSERILTQSMQREQHRKGNALDLLTKMAETHIHMQHALNTWSIRFSRSHSFYVYAEQTNATSKRLTHREPTEMIMPETTWRSIPPAALRGDLLNPPTLKGHTASEAYLMPFAVWSYRSLYWNMHLDLCRTR